MMLKVTDHTPPKWGLIGLASLLLVFLALALSGCSVLGRALEHGSQLLDTRAEKKQSGWEWERFVTCGAATIHPDLTGDGERWCVRELAPTVAGCMADQGLEFWFGDSLSGVSRRVLYDLCLDSDMGELWPHLDGIYQDGRLVVRDANRGSKPL